MSKELVSRHKGFTPGPWIVYRCVTNGPQHILSQTGLYVMDGSNQSHSKVRREADARLIADAPALLTALEASLAREERLRSALEFYANPEIYLDAPYAPKSLDTTAEHDEGTIARAALGESKS